MLGLMVPVSFELSSYCCCLSIPLFPISKAVLASLVLMQQTEHNSRIKPVMCSQARYLWRGLHCTVVDQRARSASVDANLLGNYLRIRAIQIGSCNTADAQLIRSCNTANDAQAQSEGHNSASGGSTSTSRAGA